MDILGFVATQAIKESLCYCFREWAVEVIKR